MDKIFSAAGLRGVQSQIIYCLARGNKLEFIFCLALIILAWIKRPSQITAVTNSTVVISSPLPAYVVLPHPMFLSYETLSRAPIRVTASPVLKFRPKQEPLFSTAPSSLHLKSAYYFVGSPTRTLVNDNTTFLPCPSIIIKPTGSCHLITCCHLTSSDNGKQNLAFILPCSSH
jgi:hypothetical protein